MHCITVTMCACSSWLNVEIFTTEAMHIFHCHHNLGAEDKRYVTNTLPHCNTELRTHVDTQFNILSFEILNELLSNCRSKIIYRKYSNYLILCNFIGQFYIYIYFYLLLLLTIYVMILRIFTLYWCDPWLWLMTQNMLDCTLTTGIYVHSVPGWLCYLIKFVYTVIVNYETSTHAECVTKKEE